MPLSLNSLSKKQKKEKRKKNFLNQAKMNPTLDYFSRSLLIIKNKRKSFTDREVSLLCNKDPKYCAKNNLECGKQCQGTNYSHDT